MLTYAELTPPERAEYHRILTAPRGPSDPRALMDPALAAFLHDAVTRHGHRGLDVRTFPDLERHGTRVFLGMAMHDARVLASPTRAERPKLRDIVTPRRITEFLGDLLFQVDRDEWRAENPQATFDPYRDVEYWRGRQRPKPVPHRKP